MHKDTQSTVRSYVVQLNIITNTTQIQIPLHPHKLTHTCTQAQIHTWVVLSFLLVLTAHQSPVSACRNMLTSAISLKSLSIRSSCAGPLTLCKPRVWNPPTYIHNYSELRHRHPHLCAHKWGHIHLNAYKHMPIVSKPYCIHVHTHKPTMRIRRLYLPIMHIHAVGSPWIFNVLCTMTAPLPRAWEHPA